MVSDIFAEDERERQRKKKDRGGLELAVVDTVRDNANHQVRCRVLSPREQSNGPLTATVLVNMQGDVGVPREGDLVVLATNVHERPVVIGTLYSRGEAMPSYDSEERLISHPHSAAQIRIKPSGEILIESDSGDKVEVTSEGTVVVNDGTNPVVTDVTGSDTDGSGDIDTISVTKSDDLHVP